MEGNQERDFGTFAKVEEVKSGESQQNWVKF